MMRFFRLTAPANVPAYVGADSLKKPHHIITLRFSEVVKDHAIYQIFCTHYSMNIIFCVPSRCIHCMRNIRYASGKDGQSSTT